MGFPPALRNAAAGKRQPECARADSPRAHPYSLCVQRRTTSYFVPAPCSWHPQCAPLMLAKGAAPPKKYFHTW